MEQRAAFRFPADLAADCRMADQGWSARLCNISTTGCMMVCPESGLPGGWMLRLRIRGLPAIDAEIVWHHRGHAGLRFRTPLHPAALEHLGFRLPEPRREPPARRLHAQLVKRARPEDPRPRPGAASAG
jgi:hypothetical protein